MRQTLLIELHVHVDLDQSEWLKNYVKTLIYVHMYLKPTISKLFTIKVRAN